MNARKTLILVLVAAVWVTTREATAAQMGTAFTYQGRLEDGGNPVTDTCDFEFSLWDDAAAGAQQGSAVPVTTSVDDGLFTVDLDFGEQFNGEARWLELAVCCPSPCLVQTLTPRQELTPAPHALALPGLWTQQNVVTEAPNLIGGYSRNSVEPGAVGATISGGGRSENGQTNRVIGNYGTIGGGLDNYASGYASTISGGQSNITTNDNATVAGGRDNAAGSPCTTIGGGQGNLVNGEYSTIAGGWGNDIFSPFTAIGGGVDNVANGEFSTIGGGDTNSTNGSNTTVGGGRGNTASTGQSTVGGGLDNTASGGSSTVGGGYGNTASGSNAVVAGGHGNVASGLRATVPGGANNTSQGDYSLAAGRKAKADHHGSFVWADSDGMSPEGSDFNSTGTDQFLIRAAGGVGIGTDSPAEQLDVEGNIHASGTITSGSSITVNGTTNTITSTADLELHVSSVRALRIEPDAVSPNLIGGYSGNIVTTGAYGAAIGGGGAGGTINRVFDDYGTISGGEDNRAGDDDGDTTTQTYATIGGGRYNEALAEGATIGGGGSREVYGLVCDAGPDYLGMCGECADWPPDPCFEDLDCMSGPCVPNNDNCTAPGVCRTGVRTPGNLVTGMWGTIAGGTENEVAGLEAAVGGGRGNKANDFCNTVGGGEGNTTGGKWSTVAGGQLNNAGQQRATVGGGTQNIASGLAATIGGGSANEATGHNATIAGGIWNTASGEYAAVAGGSQNNAGGSYPAVGGGANNAATANGATVGGGLLNSVGGGLGTVPGGAYNAADGTASFAAGYRAKANHDGAFVWADFTGTDFTSTGPKQFLVRAAGGVGIGKNDPSEQLDVEGNIHASGTITSGSSITVDGTANTITSTGDLELHVSSGRALRIEPDAISPNLIGGYSGNTITSGAKGATIGGGGASGSENRVFDHYGTIGGGRNNEVGADEGVPTNQTYATVGGGQGNTASAYAATVGGGWSNSTSALYGTIAGGWSNSLAMSDCSTIGGGQENTASAHHSTVGGGYGNIASGQQSTVSGGAGNTTSGRYATVPGGRVNTASGEDSFAAGRTAKANHDGAFVWADSHQLDFPSATELNFTPVANQFLARTVGGVVFVSAIDGSGNSTAGVELAAGGGSWSSLSDRKAKANLRSVDAREVLQRVAAMPVSTWNYKAQDESIRHIGPMAQDFYAAFGVGEKETMITSIDVDGVALAAIQGLYEIVKEKDAQIRVLQTRNGDLEARLAAVEQIVGKLTGKQKGGAE